MDTSNTYDKMKLTALDANRQREIIRSVSQSTGLLPVSIEKDWWVVQVLHALFSLPYADHLSFKGGTSLSKCWHLIERFSEDVDIAIDHEFLGFQEPLSKTQISDKLRRTACTFVRTTLQDDLREQLLSQGLRVEDFNVSVRITTVTTTDPETITVSYRSLFDSSPYIVNRVKVEVSGRSMSEPVRGCNVRSEIDEVYPQSIFSEGFVNVRAVSPERTFLEKVFLLQEEFSKTTEEIRVDRMSRHMYDIAMMMERGVASKALGDKDLYRKVVEHRRKFIGLKGFDYSRLEPSCINIQPPEGVVDIWRRDYESLCRHMIYGEAPSFDQLLQSMQSLMAGIK